VDGFGCYSGQKRKKENVRSSDSAIVGGIEMNKVSPFENWSMLMKAAMNKT